jgi:hypothetical protein
MTPWQWERHSPRELVGSYLLAAFVFPLILFAIVVAGAAAFWLLEVVAGRFY